MADQVPKVTEVALSKHHRFMYENFVIATQHDVYLLLEKRGDVLSAIHFGSARIKYGSPNDESRGSHPLAQHGLGIYGLFEVENSPWIKELIVANRVHSKHADAMFGRFKHYIACFKDVTLEVACSSYQEKQMSVRELMSLIHEQLDNLATD